MNEDIIYEKVLEKIIQEFSAAGAVAVAVTPLGTGPKAGSNSEDIYKSQKSSDKKYRKNKKNQQKSVQWHLKNNK